MMWTVRNLYKLPKKLFVKNQMETNSLIGSNEKQKQIICSSLAQTERPLTVVSPPKQIKLQGQAATDLNQCIQNPQNLIEAQNSLQIQNKNSNVKNSSAKTQKHDIQLLLTNLGNTLFKKVEADKNSLMPQQSQQQQTLLLRESSNTLDSKQMPAQLQMPLPTLTNEYHDQYTIDQHLQPYILPDNKQKAYISNLLQKTIVYAKTYRKVDKERRLSQNVLKQHLHINKEIRLQQTKFAAMKRPDAIMDELKSKLKLVQSKMGRKNNKGKAAKLQSNTNPKKGGMNKFPAFKILSMGLVNKTFEITQNIAKSIGITIKENQQKAPIEILMEIEEKRKQLFSSLVTKFVSHMQKNSENDNPEITDTMQNSTGYSNSDTRGMQHIPEGADIMQTIQFQEALQYEAVILESYGNQTDLESNIYQFETFIDYESKDNGTIDKQQHMHTIMCGEHNQNDIVLLHGFGGSGLTFYKMLPTLSQHFRVWCVDLLGMGLSSRPLYSTKNPEEAAAFFLNSLEQWRIKNNIETFDLVGHSLGGTISTYYASEHPKRVKTLFLLSPVGFAQENSKWVEKRLRESSLGYRLQFSLLSHLYKHKLTCSSIRRKLGNITKEFIKQYTLTQFQPKLSMLEAAMLTEYFDRICQLPESSQIGLYDLLHVPSTISKFPMLQKMEKINHIKTHMFFGDRDWTNVEGPLKMCSLDTVNADVAIVDDCGHQLEIEQGEYLANKIIQISIEQMSNQVKK